MYPSEYARNNYPAAKDYEAKPLPQFNQTDLIITLVNPKAAKGYHPTDYIIKEYPYADLYQKLSGNDEPKLGTAYPFIDPLGKGPTIMIVMAYRLFKGQAEANEKFLKEAPERTDKDEDRAYYLDKALKGIVDLDPAIRRQYFGKIKTAYLWGDNFPPYPFHPEHAFGTVFFNWAKSVKYIVKVILHPRGNQFQPKVLGNEIKIVAITSVNKPFKLVTIGGDPPKKPVENNVIPLEEEDDDSIDFLPPARPQTAKRSAEESSQSAPPRKKGKQPAQKARATPPKASTSRSMLRTNSEGYSSDSRVTPDLDSQVIEEYTQSFLSQVSESQQV